MTPPDAQQTDWDAYYRRPYRAAVATRRITAAYLEKAISRHAAPSIKSKGLVIVELGGANSCFAEGILRRFPVARYVIVDNNKTGLALSSDRFSQDDRVECLDRDIFTLEEDLSADVIFSVGLIEHFEPAQTASVLAKHFALLRKGGLAIISYPTPTFPYRAARQIAELTGRWIFHDERPLSKEEVLETITQYAETLECRIIWPIVLTQEIIACRKHG